MTMTTVNLLHSLVIHGIALPEPTALLFAGTLMIILGNLQRRFLTAAEAVKQAVTT